MHDNTIFSNWHIQGDKEYIADMLGSVFMPLLFGAEIPKDASLVYEYVSEAGPRSVDGMPMFMSCRFLKKPEAERLLHLLQILEEKDKATEPEAKGRLETMFWQG
jgi:hypothetical protein